MAGIDLRGSSSSGNAAYVPIQRRNKVLFVGDSIAVGTSSKGAVDVMTAGAPYTSNVEHGTSALTYAMLASTKAWEPYANAGVGGNTSGMILARFQTDVLALSPSLVVLMSPGYWNDIGASTSNTTIMANIASMVTSIIAAGAQPILCTPTPDGRTGSSTARVTQMMQLYRLVIEFGQKYGVPVVDLMASVVDWNNGQFATTYNSDGSVHPLPSAYNIWGQKLATVIDSYLPMSAASPALLGSIAVDPSDQLRGFGLFATDGNSDGVADQWTLSGAGTGVTASRTADANVLGGFGQTLTAASMTGSKWVQTNAITAPSPGDIIEVSGLLTTDGGVLTTVQVTANGATGYTYVKAVNTAGVALTRAPFRVRWQTPPSTTSVSVVFMVAATNGGGTTSGVSTLAQVGLRNLTTGGETAL